MTLILNAQMIAKMTKRGVKATMYKQRENTEPDVEFHYTDEELVKYCLSFIPFKKEDSVLDVGAGKNMVWFRNIPTDKKDWTEIELGKDFFDYKGKVDYCIGNPPYKFLWKMLEKSFKMCNKGVGFLIAINGINMLTPKRLQFIKEQGFYINKVVVVSCKRWYGRYFFVLFTKDKNNLYNWSLNGFN